MKVACITTVKIPAHTANSVQVMKACAALVADGHNVCLWVPDGGKSNAALEASTREASSDLITFYGLAESFPVKEIPSKARFKRYDFCWQVLSAARNWGTDVVYTWALQAAVFALLRGLPVILEMHGPPEGTFGPLLFQLYLALPGRKRILSISQALLNILDARYDLGKVTYRIAPNGVELERYTDLPDPANARQQLGFPEKLTVGYSGHFYAGRGMDLMLELARRMPEVQFLWVGGQPTEIADWQAILDDDDLTNVILTGYIENQLLPRYQAAADILIMPYERTITGSGGGNSAAYCSPMKMFEYMACGRAIVSSDLPVIGEVLNATNAVLCPPEDIDAWQDGLQSLLRDPQRRDRLAQQAKTDIQAYTWQRRAHIAMDGLL